MNYRVWNYQKWNKKDRRHDGWRYPRLTISGKKQDIIDNCLEPQPYWDDWIETRDGFRDGMSDSKMIKKVERDLCLPPKQPRTVAEAVLIKLFGEEEEPCESCQNRRNWNAKQKKLLNRRKLMKTESFK